MIDKIEFQKRIGRRIEGLRKQKNLSQRGLAKLCLKEGSNINKIEHGEFNPSAYYLYEIATALGVPVTELFVGLEG